MIQRSRQVLTTKRLIIIAAAAAIMMTSASIASMASAQTSGSKSGTIASLQNGKNGKPEWILSGGWEFRNINSSSPAFTATFNMVMLNGSAPHNHSRTEDHLFRILQQHCKQIVVYLCS